MLQRQGVKAEACLKKKKRAKGLLARRKERLPHGEEKRLEAEEAESNRVRARS